MADYKIPEACSMRENFKPSRIVHLHPTLRCNLQCIHCYSSSRPGLKDQFDIKSVLEFLRHAYDAGYDTISISGGEPFLFHDLNLLLAETKKIGFRNIAVSNGMLLKKTSALALLELLDLLAISIDGPKELHNKMRNLPSAFDKMMEGVDVLKNQKTNWGFIHTVTSDSWKFVLQLAELCYSLRGKLLQFHPLESAGRANSLDLTWYPDQMSLHKAYIMIAYLFSKYSPVLNVKSDFFHRDVILESRNFLIDDCTGETAAEKFSKALPILVIDEKGRILPFSYGFSPQYSVGNVSESVNWNERFDAYIKNQLVNLKNLFLFTYNQVAEDRDNEMVIWTDKIVRNSFLLMEPA